MNAKEIVKGFVPLEALAFLEVAKAKKGQGSLEYVMMLSAASIVILIALAMVVKLKGSAISSVSVNGTNMSVSDAISQTLKGIASNSV